VCAKWLIVVEHFAKVLVKYLSEDKISQKNADHISILSCLGGGIAGSEYSD
jgi:hypothetical protein